MCEKRYLKAIYATANKYGLCERSSECDDLHAIVYNITRKVSIRDLNDSEAMAVLRELQKYEPVGKGKMTDAQIRKAWAVFYKLKEFDADMATTGGAQAYSMNIPGCLRGGSINGTSRTPSPTKECGDDCAPIACQQPSPNGSLRNKKATDGDRMCGIIKKVTGISAVAKAPFKWLSTDDGEKVIEYLKRYVRSAERKKK